MVEGKRRDSYSGASRVAHDEAQAEELLSAGLVTLKLHRQELDAMRKSDPRKQVLAWWIRKQTVVGNQWLTDKLKMGHPGNLSKMVKVVEIMPTQEIKRMKKQVVRKRGIPKY